MPDAPWLVTPLRRLKGPLQGCRVDVLRALSRRHQPPRVSWQSAPVSSHRLGDRELLSRGGHHSGTFGIRRIHLDGSLDLEFAVECEEASCNVAGYKCPVLGLAVSDEGREECHTLHTKFQGALPLDQSFIGGRDEKWGQRDLLEELSSRIFIANFHCEFSLRKFFKLRSSKNLRNSSLRG